jgi:hypothetical protein
MDASSRLGWIRDVFSPTQLQPNISFPSFLGFFLFPCFLISCFLGIVYRLSSFFGSGPRFPLYDSNFPVTTRLTPGFLAKISISLNLINKTTSSNSTFSWSSRQLICPKSPSSSRHALRQEATDISHTPLPVAHHFRHHFFPATTNRPVPQTAVPASHG